MSAFAADSHLIVENSHSILFKLLRQLIDLDVPVLMYKLIGLSLQCGQDLILLQSALGYCGLLEHLLMGLQPCFLQFPICSLEVFLILGNLICQLLSKLPETLMPVVSN